MDLFLNFYENLLHVVAEIAVHTLELIGIAIIIFGSVKTLIRVIKKLRKKDYESRNVMIELGRALALALEFKMGAEIVNTVIVRDLKELAVLAIIIGLRALLAILIHWEITTERKESEINDQKKEEKSEKDSTQ